MDSRRGCVICTLKLYGTVTLKTSPATALCRYDPFDHTLTAKVLLERGREAYPSAKATPSQLI